MGEHWNFLIKLLKLTLDTGIRMVYIQSMINLTDDQLERLTASEYAALVNEYVRNTMQESVNGWCGMLVESADHWAEYNIHTGADLDAVARQYDDEWTAAELDGDAARDMGWD